MIKVVYNSKTFFVLVIGLSFSIMLNSVIDLKIKKTEMATAAIKISSLSIIFLLA
jgi:hypothetical protein